MEVRRVVVVKKHCYDYTKEPAYLRHSCSYKSYLQGDVIRDKSFSEDVLPRSGFVSVGFNSLLPSGESFLFFPLAIRLQHDGFYRGTLVLFFFKY